MPPKTGKKAAIPATAKTTTKPAPTNTMTDQVPSPPTTTKKTTKKVTETTPTPTPKAEAKKAEAPAVPATTNATVKLSKAAKKKLKLAATPKTDLSKTIDPVAQALAASRFLKSGKTIDAKGQPDITAAFKKTLETIQKEEKSGIKRKAPTKEDKSKKKAKLNNKKIQTKSEDSDSEVEDYMVDVDKDEYADDMVDVDDDGNRLVTLTSDLIKAAAVRSKEEDSIDDLIQKQREKQYLRRKEDKVPEKDDSDKANEEEKLKRTIFLSNVSVKAKDSDIKSFIGRDIPVESLRYRAAGFDSTKVAKWVAFAQKQFHEKRDTLSVFIVLKNASDVSKVLKLNQSVLLDKHIRVDLAANDGKVDHRHSVFVGNLPFDITEEALYTIFHKIGEISAIRCVRDAKNGMGRGIAFVSFIDKLHVTEALKLHNKKFDGVDRNLRITKVSPQAFDKTETFKVQLMKQRVLHEKRKKLNAIKSRSEKLRQAALGDDAPSTEKRIKIQGSFQKTFGNVGGGNSAKKPRHNRAQEVVPSWQGSRAKPSDSLGRNKASSTAKNLKDKHVKSIQKRNKELNKKKFF